MDKENLLGFRAVGFRFRMDIDISANPPNAVEKPGATCEYKNPTCMFVWGSTENHHPSRTINVTLNPQTLSI